VGGRAVVVALLIHAFVGDPGKKIVSNQENVQKNLIILWDKGIG
jgi:hypothetical protein